MKKIFSAMCIIMCLMSTIPYFADEPAQLPEVTVFIDGEQLIYPNQNPVIIEGRTLVPMRATFEKLGANIYWDGDTMTVISTKGETSIVIQIDNNLMIVNNSQQRLDVPAKLINSRTMIPLRAVSQALGYGVKWDGDLFRVDIVTEITE